MDPYKDELAAAAIDYRPFAISCWGRLHPNARQMLISLAKRIARREGSHSYQQVLTRLEARISALIWRRAARMMLQCLPHVPVDGAPTVDQPTVISPEAEQRAGHPSSVDLPLYISSISAPSPAPPSGAHGALPSGVPPTGGA